jgi:hypothetical protein
VQKNQTHPTTKMTLLLLGSHPHCKEGLITTTTTTIIIIIMQISSQVGELDSQLLPLT